MTIKSPWINQGINPLLENEVEEAFVCVTRLSGQITTQTGVTTSKLEMKSTFY